MSILDTGRLLLLWAVAVGGSHLLLHLRAYARSEILSSGQTDVLAAVDFLPFLFCIHNGALARRAVVNRIVVTSVIVVVVCSLIRCL